MCYNKYLLCTQCDFNPCKGVSSRFKGKATKPALLSVNTEGIRSALARFRSRTGPTLPQPSPSVSQQPLPVDTDLPFQAPPEQQNNPNGSTNHRITNFILTKRQTTNT
uniref:Uncharacterized protein n=1 Tax=Glossina austeni TaxID=7395 RepID=A0A1A9UZE1_GLOAU